MKFIIQAGDDDGLQDFIKGALLNGLELEVTAKQLGKSKSWEQLKGIYKLFQLALPHFQKWKPDVNWDLEMIKEFAKSELGYTRQSTGFEIAMMIKQSGFNPSPEEKRRMVKFCRRIKQNLSFEDFTMKQLYDFTRQFEVWALEAKGDKPSWQDVFLDDGEKNSLLEFCKANFNLK